MQILEAMVSKQKPRAKCGAGRPSKQYRLLPAGYLRELADKRHAAINNAYFRCEVWRNQSGTELEEPSLLFGSHCGGWGYSDC